VTTKKRWVCAAAGFSAMIFLGLVYAWSVFVAPLEAYFGWDRSQTSMIFSISVLGFSLGIIFGGILSKRLPPKKVMWFCATLALIGFACTSRINTLPGLFLFYGVMCSFGAGTGYNAVLSMVLPWFPKNQGALSGIMLMGFGFSGSILGWTAAALTNSFGWRNAFAILGVGIWIIIVLLSFLMVRPTDQESEVLAKKTDGAAAKREYTMKEMAKTSLSGCISCGGLSCAPPA